MHIFCDIQTNYIPGLLITNSIAPSGKASRPEQTSAKYPPPPAPGIFHARTPGIAEYLSIYSCTPGWIIAGNIAI